MAPKKQGTLSTSSWTSKPKSQSNPIRIETKATIKADLKRRESEKEQALLNNKKRSSSTSTSTNLKRSASASSFGSNTSADSKKKRDSLEKKVEDGVKREKLNVYNKGYDQLWAKTSKAMGLPKCKPSE